MTLRTRSVKIGAPVRVSRVTGSSEALEVVVVAAEVGRRRRLLAALGSLDARPSSLDELVALDALDLPSVAVLSCDGVRGEGLDALARLRGLDDLHAVLVTPAATPGDVREALAAGARGLVLENTIEASLRPTVAAAAAGQLVLPPSAGAHVAPPPLSSREKQVLGLVVLGFSNHAIAARLHLSEATVKSHLTASFRKLGVRSRSEATARILDPNTGLGLGILSIADPDLELDVFDEF